VIKPPKSLHAFVIEPGSELDGLTFGELCQRLGPELVKTYRPDAPRTIHLYRKITIDGRWHYVRVHFEVPFLAIVPSQ